MPLPSNSRPPDHLKSIFNSRGQPSSPLFKKPGSFLPSQIDSRIVLTLPFRTRPTQSCTQAPLIISKTNSSHPCTSIKSLRSTNQNFIRSTRSNVIHFKNQKKEIQKSRTLDNPNARLSSNRTDHASRPSTTPKLQNRAIQQDITTARQDRPKKSHRILSVHFRRVHPNTPSPHPLKTNSHSHVKRIPFREYPSSVFKRSFSLACCSSARDNRTNGSGQRRRNIAKKEKKKSARLRTDY